MILKKFRDKCAENDLSVFELETECENFMTDKNKIKINWFNGKLFFVNWDGQSWFYRLLFFSRYFWKFR